MTRCARTSGFIVGAMLWAASLPPAGLLAGPMDSPSGAAGEFAGEVVAKPQSLTDVVAPLWGKMFLEEGVLPGVKVKKGQNLARVVLELDALERLPLNDRTIEVNQFLEVSSQKLRLALDDYRRAMRVGNKSPDFTKEVERRKHVYENALAEFQLATQQKARQEQVLKSRDPRTVRVTAPLDGYIDEIFFVPGQVNLTGEFRKLFTIVDISTVWVRAEVYEKDLAAFRTAADAAVSTDAYPGQTFRGTFQAFGSQIDPNARTIPVFYEVPNRGEKLKLGLRVRIRPEKKVR